MQYGAPRVGLKIVRVRGGFGTRRFALAPRRRGGGGGGHDGRMRKPRRRGLGVVRGRLGWAVV